MNLNELYTQIITENSRSKQNRHPVEGATHSLEGVNPSCGDDITLQLRVMDGKIEDAGFIGTGCAISQASASLMIDLVKGRTVEDARRLIGLYFDMIKGKIFFAPEIYRLIILQFGQKTFFCEFILNII